MSIIALLCAVIVILSVTGTLKDVVNAVLDFFGIFPEDRNGD